MILRRFGVIAAVPYNLPYYKSPLMSRFGNREWHIERKRRTRKLTKYASRVVKRTTSFRDTVKPRTNVETSVLKTRNFSAERRRVEIARLSDGEVRKNLRGTLDRFHWNPRSGKPRNRWNNVAVPHTGGNLAEIRYPSLVKKRQT